MVRLRDYVFTHDSILKVVSNDEIQLSSGLQHAKSKMFFVQQMRVKRKQLGTCSDVMTLTALSWPVKTWLSRGMTLTRLARCLCCSVKCGRLDNFDCDSLRSICCSPAAKELAGQGEKSSMPSTDTLITRCRRKKFFQMQFVNAGIEMEEPKLVQISLSDEAIPRYLIFRSLQHQSITEYGQLSKS